VDAAPTALAYFPVAHDAFGQHPARRELFYGLANGDLGQLFLDAKSCHQGTLLENSTGRGAVTALFSAFDMSADGMDEIAVGRDDGSFEIYNMDNCGRLQLVRISWLAWTHFCGQLCNAPASLCTCHYASQHHAGCSASLPC
jgi:hypothetical protein